jgi:hypothetical protein
MVDVDSEVALMRAEIERLRRLVGPSEQSYADLRDELLAARDAAKSAEAAAGELRGELTEVYVELARARQIEAVLRKTFSGRVFLAARWLRRFAGRVRRRLAARLR